VRLEKPSHLLAAVTWLFVFLLAIALIFRAIPSDGLSWGLLALFFFVAVMASAVASGGSKESVGIYHISYIDADTIQLVQLDPKTLQPIATSGAKPNNSKSAKPGKS
jgi:uncharacterized membrane protein YhaH (DUF805 family)